MSWSSRGTVRVACWRGDPRPLHRGARRGLRVARLELRDRDLEELVIDAYRTDDAGDGR
jgi:hypothetical protein